MKENFQIHIWLGLLLCLLGMSCSDDTPAKGDDPGNGNTELEVNEWIESVMRSDYLWNNDIPAQNKLDFSADPQTFFRSMLSLKDGKTRNGKHLYYYSYMEKNKDYKARTSIDADDTYGMEFTLFNVVNDSNQPLGYYYARILYVLPNSPASSAGLERGDWKINDMKKKREIVITNNESGESKTYLIPFDSRIKIMDGTMVEAGDALTEGSINPHDILKIKGVRAVQDYLLQEVQRVYRLQGVEINDKHIEMIVRQMLKKIRVEDNGDSDFLPGTLVDILDYWDENERLVAEGKQPADGKQVLLGITKASLATNSFLSAASFQETTKVLTEAAIKGKVDPLIGLKENVIIGKLIPAGTGMKRYRDVKLNTDMEEDDSLSISEEDEVLDLAEDTAKDEEFDDVDTAQDDSADVEAEAAEAEESDPEEE